MGVLPFQEGCVLPPRYAGTNKPHYAPVGSLHACYAGRMRYNTADIPDTGHLPPAPVATR